VSHTPALPVWFPTPTPSHSAPTCRSAHGLSSGRLMSSSAPRYSLDSLSVPLSLHPSQVFSMVCTRSFSSAIYAFLPPPRNSKCRNRNQYPLYSSYGYACRRCAQSFLSLSPSSIALTVFPKSVALILPLAIRFNDVSNDAWRDDFSECFHLRLRHSSLLLQPSSPLSVEAV